MTRTAKRKKEHEKSFLAETVIRSEGNNNSGVEVIGLKMDDQVVLPAVFCMLLDLNVSPDGEEDLRVMGGAGNGWNYLNGPYIHAITSAHKHILFVL